MYFHDVGLLYPLDIPSSNLTVCHWKLRLISLIYHKWWGVPWPFCMFTTSGVPSDVRLQRTLHTLLDFGHRGATWEATGMKYQVILPVPSDFFCHVLKLKCPGILGYIEFLVLQCYFILRERDLLWWWASWKWGAMPYENHGRRWKKCSQDWCIPVKSCKSMLPSSNSNIAMGNPLWMEASMLQSCLQCEAPQL
jgi:hypothetical protein